MPAYPECVPWVAEWADFVGSTAAIAADAVTSKRQEFIWYGTQHCETLVLSRPGQTVLPAE
ncbi:MAG: hypothetical protein KHW65_07950 [Clostridiales bacterium]|nr:hypothetical protein [Clostridiales bacterium]